MGKKKEATIFGQGSQRPQRYWWAPGGYFCTCILCEQQFTGDKRASHCVDCAYHDLDELDRLIELDGEVVINYPKDSKMKFKGGQLLDFINEYIATHSVTSTYMRSIGYWTIIRKEE